MSIDTAAPETPTAPRWETEAQSDVERLRPIAKAARSLAERQANEGAVRLLVADVLGDVLGYDKYTDLSTEKRERDLVDIVVSADDDQETILVEVKKAGLRLADKHLEQVLPHAKRHDITWIVLTNGVTWQVFHAATSTLVFTVDLDTVRKEDLDLFVLLHKQMIKRGRLDQEWRRRVALSAVTLRKVLQSHRVLTSVRLEIKAETGVNPDEMTIKDTLLSMVNT